MPDNAIILPECIRVGQVSDGYHTFDELYEHRQILFCVLLSICQRISWKSRKHADGSMFDGDWFVAGIDLTGGCGPVTYHLEGRYWNHANCKELEFAPEWDGHTSADVVKRLRRWLIDE